MKKWRLEWALQMHWREERITDIGVVRGLIGNVSFFATTTVFVISGLLAFLGASTPIVERLNEQPHMTDTNSEAFALKICALLLLAVMAFFKFGWAMRLHAYTLLIVGAAPSPEQRNSPQALAVSERVTAMSYLASKHYLDGVRAYYLGLCALTWIISAWLFFPTLLVVVLVLVRRDFFSEAFSLSRFEVPTN